MCVAQLREAIKELDASRICVLSTMSQRAFEKIAGRSQPSLVSDPDATLAKSLNIVDFNGKPQLVAEEGMSGRDIYVATQMVVGSDRRLKYLHFDTEYTSREPPSSYARYLQ
mmetsp:Transcript_48476/g.113846  ORF Transcript_48476/g.113846 Transcript_48476/m.113846 type:complete len:112 (-) Transcript_48476:119-454(-)